MKLNTLLKSIGSTEESSFNEICQALGDDCPEKGDSVAWGELFRLIDSAEKSGLIEVSRTNRRTDSAILTEAGAARVKEL